MLSCDNCGYPATHIKIACNLEVDRVNFACDMVNDIVGHLFVKRPLIPETPKVKFQRFQFYAKIFRDVFDFDVRKIRLSSKGAKAGKLGTIEFDMIRTSWFGIAKRLNFFAWFSGHGPETSRHRVVMQVGSDFDLHVAITLELDISKTRVIIEV